MNPFDSLSAMYSFKTSSSLWGIPYRGPNAGAESGFKEMEWS